MFDHCHGAKKSNNNNSTKNDESRTNNASSIGGGISEKTGSESGGGGSRCADVAGKLAQIFGWRHKYDIQRLHQVNNVHVNNRKVSNQISWQRSTHSIKHKLNNSSNESVNVTQSLSLSEPNLQSAGSWVAVHSLQSREGGILDPDDRLLDVADDREQIVATFEDGDEHHQHQGGDGASGSSVGTPSPDIFQGTTAMLQDKYQNDIEVTSEHIQSGLPVPLQVRRGSEPALNQLLPNTASTNSHLGSALPPVSENSKRWSAAPIITDPKERHTTTKKDDRGTIIGNGHHHHHHHHHSSSNETRNNKWRTTNDVDEDDDLPPRLSIPFSRDGSNRLSMQFLGDSPGGLRWADAAERAVNNRVQSLSLPRESRRKEPLGQATSPDNNRYNDSTEYIVLDNTESGKLGIHVVPDYDSLGKDRGLLVQRIEPDGRVIRDGRLSVYDRIVEINGRNLLDQPFHVVQDIFRDSLRSPELRLRVVKHRPGIKKPPPPVYPKPPPPHVITTQPTHSHSHSSSDKENIGILVEGEERSMGSSSSIATVSPTKKLPVASGSLQTANTRKIGRKMELELLKGPHGLGFSITTRDNPAGGNCPIYIKNILPKGAAVEDGRLKPGDRLLAVDGIELTGKSQSEAVAVLRNVPLGSKVRIVVSRQEDVGGTTINSNSRSVDATSTSAVVNNNSNSSSNKIPTSFKTIKTDNDSNKSVNNSNNNNNSMSSNSSGSSTHNQVHNQVRHSDNNSNNNNNSSSNNNNNSQSTDENYVYPWRQRETLTFNIPVHDTEKAGLGVSVKGKTSASQGPGMTQSVDLGIFIKNVLHGGAASRDGRLRTNDQLLNVNGISLLSLSNAAAMETLRRAMVRTEGPVEGAITLTVARRIDNNSHQRRDSLSSLLTDSSANTETFGGVSRDNVTTGGGSSATEYTTNDNSGTSENSDNTVIFLPPQPSSSTSQKPISHLDGVVMRNPVLDRLTGQTSSLPAGVGNLHNESYYRATHQTTIMSLGGNSTVNNKLNSPTVNQPSGETVIIEEDSPFLPNSVQRGGGGGGGVPGSDPQNKQPRGSTSSTATTVDATYASQLSLDESVAAGFSRDAFGRQSMSEKRHATLDAKNTDTYQRNKKLREEREKQRQEELIKEGKLFNRDGTTGGIMRVNSAESIPRSETGNGDMGSKTQLGPSLGMKKSSSLESLQTMVQEIQMAEDASTYRNGQGAVRVIRGRGCNESFRAAVDRSYDAPLSLHELRMDTLAEDDGECVLGPRQSSLDSKLKGKKKPGILKGIGSMFRFGKHRKSMEGDDDEREREAARRAAREEQERIQEQYRRLLRQQQQQQQQQQQHQQSTDSGQSQHIRELGIDAGMPTCHTNSSPSSGSPAGNINEPSRTERIQQLRAQHQRRHVERRGHYPLDEREERYEEAIRQRLEHHPDIDSINRPGSRIGITDPAKFSHYVNYQEIQHHLNSMEYEKEKQKVKLRRPVTMMLPIESQSSSTSTLNLNDEESRRQQHYHSQRRDNRELSHRPVSNFYEYESVQAVMRNHDTNCNSLPRRPDFDIPVPTHGLSNIPSGYTHGSGSSRLYQPFNTNSHYYNTSNNNNNNINSNSNSNTNIHHMMQQSSSSSTSSSSYHLQNHRNSATSNLLSSQRKPHGPFVTHVTIRECQQQATGPKV
ncbi:par-3 family cell polarity regulator [Lycorma delicatula]|uniref:par-3 family cell polarity regulator n=1 Tax=Lycorma delicatula TaxID=130591 RepID=UPI003F51354F